MPLHWKNDFQTLSFLVHIWILLVWENGQNLVTGFKENCFEDSESNTSLCSSSTSGLQVRFCPRIQSTYQFDSGSLKEITCSTNRKANTTIIFDGKPLNGVKGLARLVDNECNKTIKFEGKSICLNGTYECVAEDGSGTKIAKRAYVTILNSDWNFDFKNENVNLQQSQEMILGTSVNLTCTVSGADWKSNSRLDAPTFFFDYLNSEGKIISIRESEQLPKKFFFTPVELNRNHYPLQFIRKLQISNITANDSGSYICKIASQPGHCIVRRTTSIYARPCKAGHFCMPNSSEELPCRAGTYNNNTGALNQSACLPCPKGYYCPERSSFPLKCPTSKQKYSLRLYAKSLKDCNLCMTGTCDQSGESSENLTWIYGVVVGIVLLVGCVVMSLFMKQRLTKQRRGLSSTSSDKNMLQAFTTAHITEEFLSEPSRQVQCFPKQKEDYEHIYDVFICYSSLDKEWVRKTLIQTLLEKNLRVCIDYRDFAPGAHIIKNIADAIYQSRKTIAVLSPDYITSAWCNEELQMALRRIEDEHQVIPVLYRQCEIPEFLKHRTYLDWCNQDVRPYFWDQLIAAINDGKQSQVINDESLRISIEN